MHNSENGSGYGQGQQYKLSVRARLLELGSEAMKKDAGANWVAAAQGADGYRCGRNNGSAGATAAVTRARSWCARGRCRWKWRLG